MGAALLTAGVWQWLGVGAEAEPVCTKEWTGDIDDDYRIGGNWFPTGVPTSNDFACAGPFADIYLETPAFNAVKGINFEGSLEIAEGELRIGVSGNAEESYVGELTVSGRRGGSAHLTVGDTLTMWGGGLGSPNGVVSARGGRTTVAPEATLYVDDGLPLAGQHTLRIEGESSWFNGDVLICDGSLIENAGYFELPTDGFSVLPCGAAMGEVKNESSGTIVKLASGFDDTVATRLQNNGTLLVESDTLHVTGDLTNLVGTTLTGGVYDLEGVMRVAEATTGVVTNAADLRLSTDGQFLNGSGVNALAVLATNSPLGRLRVGNGQELGISPKFSNAGQVVVDGAGSRISLPGASAAYAQTGGVTSLGPSATLSLPGASSAVNLNGGRLEGSGTIEARTVKNNGGIVAPGTSPGVLDISGAFEQGAGGTLEIDINGTVAGTGYDRLAVTGAAKVGGTLALSTGFVPADPDEFQVLTTSGRAGSFSVVNGQPGPGKVYRVIYNATSVTVTPAPPNPGVLFTPLDPVRIVDSRPSSQAGPYSTPWLTQTIRPVKVAGGAGPVPADAEAVVLNVTAAGTSASSHLRIYPTGEDLPIVSNLNWQSGWTIPNAVTVKVGTDGNINVYNNNGSADVIIDVVGYYKPDAGAGFTSLDPVRLIDSRPSSQAGPFGSPWSTQQTRNVAVTGYAGSPTGVPSGADAVVLNVTVTGTSASSNLRLWPTGLSTPLVSNLNWQAGWTVPNAVTVKVGLNNQINVYNNNGSADVIIDVVGYFDSGTGAAFHPLTPTRIQDSRPASKVGPYASPWAAQITRPVTVRDVGGVPFEATAVLLNTTVTGTTASSNLRVWPSGPTPLVSSLNWRAGWTIANAVTAKVGPNTVNVYNNNGNTDVIADVAGWYG